MKNAKLLVNWYKPTGKWYSKEEIYVPNDLETWNNQHIAYIENNQSQLYTNFKLGDWYMSVSCIEQDEKDSRFFERLVKYPRSRNETQDQ